MILDNLTTLLILSLITNSDKAIKEQRKLIIKLAKKSTGVVNSLLTNVLNAPNLRKEVVTICDNHAELVEAISVYRAGGAHGVVITDDQTLPVFVLVKNDEDKTLALESELGIIRAAAKQVLNYGYNPGDPVTIMMFAGVGFSGLPYSTMVG